MASELLRAIHAGDRVAYSRTYLRDLGLHTGWHPFARGVVESITVLSSACVLVRVQWDDRSTPSNVNIANLVREDRISLE